MKRRNAQVLATVVLALALTLGWVSPTSAAPTLYPNPNPGGSTILNNQLPNCSSLSGTKASEMAGQGWTGDWQLPLSIGTRNAWATLLLPCWGTSGAAGPQVFANARVLNDSGTYTAPAPTIRIDLITYWCNGVKTVDPLAPYSYNGGIPNSSVNTWISGANSNPNFCKTAASALTRIDVNWSASWNSTLLVGTASWRPSLWLDGTINAPPANVGLIPLPNGAGETPVVCPYTIVTTDMLSTVSSFFTSFGPWFNCLWTPSGWDRSAQIPDTWQTTGISKTGDIITAVLPGAGSIYCGDLATNTALVSFAINTCDATNAVPSWVKLAIATILVIALLYLFVRRVQWTVTK